MPRLCKLALLAVAWPLSAAAEPCPRGLGDSSVHLLTFSPGTAVESAFGHTALLLWEPSEGMNSRVYDFGHFDASDPVELVRGMVTDDQNYEVGRQTMSQMMKIYSPGGRGIVAQQLALDPAESRALAASLEEILANEPSFHYNWYRPNCTTRIGDLLDQTLGGRLARQHQGPSGTSKAEEVLRHAAPLPWLWFSLHWGCGREAHRELTDWESAFLPVTLMQRIGASEKDGAPLVTLECELLAQRLPSTPREAPRRDGTLAAIGLGATVGLLAAERANRRLGLVLTGLLGLAVGLFGTAALVLELLGGFGPAWRGTHDMPFANPLHLGLVAAAVLSWRRPESRTPVRIALGVLAVASAGVLWALVSGFADRNLGILLMLVPPLLAVAWALRPQVGPAQGTAEQPSG